jgi:hypothetical protein
MNPKPFTKVMKHDTIERLFEDIYMVRGTAAFKKPMPVRFSRNMTIIRQGNDLTLINSVRLSDQGLQELDALGQVKHVVRLAGFHGMDDPFYKERYGATIWSVDAPYASGVSTEPAAENIYFKHDLTITPATELPIADAQVVLIDSAKPKEALLLLNREGGILVSGDSLQNWAKADKHFNFLAKIMMKKGGFIKAGNVGPAWLKFTKPEVSQIKNILDLQFDNLIPAHGTPVIGDAKELYRPCISNL